MTSRDKNYSYYFDKDKNLSFESEAFRKTTHIFKGAVECTS